MYMKMYMNCTNCTLEKSEDFSLLQGNSAPFVHEMSAPLRGIINVTLYASMGHSSKDVTMDFIIREVLFTECFFSPFS